MKFQLRGTPNPNYSYTEQILANRGIPPSEFYHYLHTTDNDINDYSSLGEDLLELASQYLIDAVMHDETTLIVVD